MSDEPAIVRANRKITDATNWRGDVQVSLGNEVVTFQHRLLNENEFLDVKRELNLSETTGEDEQGNVGQTDAQERLLELQQKEELADEEEEELRELSQQVAQQTDQIEDALGDEGYKLFTELGKKTIEPDDESVEYVYDTSPSEAKELMGVNKLPNPLTKDVIREHLTSELQDMVTDQPYPIKLNVGMQAFSETLSVLGNGLQQ